MCQKREGRLVVIPRKGFQEYEFLVLVSPRSTVYLLRLDLSRCTCIQEDGESITTSVR